MWHQKQYDLRPIVPGLASSMAVWPIAFTAFGTGTTGSFPKTVYSPWINLTAGPMPNGNFSVAAVEIQASDLSAGTADVYIELQHGTTDILTLHVKNLTNAASNFTADTWDPAAETLHQITPADCAIFDTIDRVRWRLTANKNTLVRCLGSMLTKWG